MADNLVPYNGNYSGSNIDRILAKADSSQTFTQEEKDAIAAIPNTYLKLEDIPVMTQEEYDALETKTAKFYLIIEDAD